MAYPNFANGVDAVTGYGDKWYVAFKGTWAFGDNWSVAITSGAGNVTLGVGYFGGLSATCVFTYRGRVYLGLGSRFNFSANNDPTGWEEQDIGAGYVSYLSSFGGQDTVKAFSQLQGRLAVFGRRSIQLWTVDADPNAFVLVQALDNIGTQAPLSVQNLGDFDVLFLDDSGVRSLRSREVTLNAFVDDVGNPIDPIIQAVAKSYFASACSVVEPTTKNYWLYLSGAIYVLSRYPTSKISAWSTYLPTANVVTTINLVNLESIYSWVTTPGVLYYYTKGAGDDYITNGSTQISASGYFLAVDSSVGLQQVIGQTPTGTLKSYVQTAFTPEKFVVYNGLIYARTTEGKLVVYGGSSGAAYDNCQATVITPWLDHGEPTLNKESIGIAAGITGAWVVSASMNPYDGTGQAEAVISQGSTTSPDSTKDSTFDALNYAFQSFGTHVQFKMVSSALSFVKAKVSSLIWKYKKGQHL